MYNDCYFISGSDNEENEFFEFSENSEDTENSEISENAENGLNTEVSEEVESSEDSEDSEDSEYSEIIGKGENTNNEKYQSETVVSDLSDYSSYFENLQSIGLTLIIICVSGFLALCFAVGLKHE